MHILSTHRTRSIPSAIERVFWRLHKMLTNTRLIMKAWPIKPPSRDEITRYTVNIGWWKCLNTFVFLWTNSTLDKAGSPWQEGIASRHMSHTSWQYCRSHRWQWMIYRYLILNYSGYKAMVLKGCTETWRKWVLLHCTKPKFNIYQSPILWQLEKNLNEIFFCNFDDSMYI